MRDIPLPRTLCLFQLPRTTTMGDPLSSSLPHPSLPPPTKTENPTSLYMIIICLILTTQGIPRKQSRFSENRSLMALKRPIGRRSRFENSKSSLFFPFFYFKISNPDFHVRICAYKWGEALFCLSRSWMSEEQGF